MRKWITKIGLIIFRHFSFILSALTFLSILFILIYDSYNNKFYLNSVTSVQTDIITISGILSAIIIAYLTSKVLQIRSERIAKFPKINELTQKLHKFRAIIDRLLHSNLWPNNLRGSLNYDYKGLTYFDIREIVFVEGKPTEQARKFARDENYGGIANLILELESFVFDEIPFDETLYSEFDVPILYSTEILEKWIKYDCGNGLWYYFENKYSIYREHLRLGNVYTGYQEEIKEYAMQIDRERYKDIDFSAELLAKLGTQIHSDIIPSLYRKQITIENNLPSIITFLFGILCLLIVFGIALPLLIKVFLMSYIFNVISLSVVISICVLIITSLYRFLKKEIQL